MITGLHVGHVLNVLSWLPAESVQCVVTSPPYFGLRDYGDAGQEWPAVEYTAIPGLPPIAVPEQVAALGLEPDPYAYAGHLVAVCRELWRVLRRDGTLWLNLGDSYARRGKAPARRDHNSGRPLGTRGQQRYTRDVSAPGRPLPRGIKAKDLIGVPWLVAQALRCDGWYLRAEVIWAKPNPVPESVRDRPTRAHETVFLLSKAPRYFFDADALREPHADLRETKHGARALRGQASLRPVGRPGMNDAARWYHKGGRNARTVWTITPDQNDGIHHAVMPEELARRCILAGSRPGDLVFDPFMGAGTVAVVAERYGRRWGGCELMPAHAEEAIARILAAREQLGTLAAGDAGVGQQIGLFA